MPKFNLVNVLVGTGIVLCIVIFAFYVGRCSKPSPEAQSEYGNEIQETIENNTSVVYTELTKQPSSKLIDAANGYVRKHKLQYNPLAEGTELRSDGEADSE